MEGDLNNAVINGTEFIGNKATTNNTKYGGGAIAVEGNRAVVNESNFTNCYAMYGKNHKVMVRIYKTIIDKPKKI